MVASAENDDVDLVKYGFTVFNISKKNICCNNSPIYNDILYDKNGLYNDYIYILKNEVNIYIWDALYRSDFIKILKYLVKSYWVVNIAMLQLSGR